MYERIVVPSVLYRAETWDLNGSDRKRLKMMEMKYSKSMCGLTISVTIKNEGIRRRDILVSVEKSVLRYSGNVEKLDNEGIVKSLDDSGVEGR